MIERLVTLLAVEGYSDTAAAKAVSTKRETVTQQAVTAWKARHQDLLGAARAKVAEAAEEHLNGAVELWITDKHQRMALRQRLIEGAAALIQARGGLPSGKGLEAVDHKVIGEGKKAREVEVRRYDSALLRDIDRLLTSTAEELGHLPKPPALHVETNVNVGPSPFEQTQARLFQLLLERHGGQAALPPGPEDETSSENGAKPS